MWLSSIWRIILLVSFTWTISAYDDICKNQNHLQDCLNKLPPLTTKDGLYGIPDSKEQLDTVCIAFKQGMKCIDDYAKTCHTELVQKIINENVAGARHTFGFLCDDPLFQSEFLQYAPCYRSMVKDWDFCAQRFIQNIPPQGAYSKQATIDTCCAKQAFYRCVYEFGNMKCRADAAAFLRRVAETLTSVHNYKVPCFPDEAYERHCSSASQASPSIFGMLVLLAIIAVIFFFTLF